MKWVALVVVAALSGCIYESYDYDFFPVCDADALPHLERKVANNDDANQVALAATQDGWENVRVDNNFWTPAVVSGDCLQSVEDGGRQ